MCVIEFAGSKSIFWNRFYLLMKQRFVLIDGVRRGGRAAEGSCLLSSCRVTPTLGSNPSPSVYWLINVGYSYFSNFISKKY